MLRVGTRVRLLSGAFTDTGVYNPGTVGVVVKELAGAQCLGVQVEWDGEPDTLFYAATELHELQELP